MIRRALPYVALCALLAWLVSVMALEMARPSTGQPAPLQGTPVAIGLEAGDGVTLDGIRAEILADSSIGPWQPWAAIDHEGGGIVWTVAEPGYIHYVACGAPAPDDGTGWHAAYLPVAVRPRVRR